MDGNGNEEYVKSNYDVRGQCGWFPVGLEVWRAMSEKLVEHGFFGLPRVAVGNRLIVGGRNPRIIAENLRVILPERDTEVWQHAARQLIQTAEAGEFEIW